MSFLKYIITTLFIFSFLFVFAQSEIDSLYSEINKTTNDSSKIDLYIQLSKKYFLNDDYINYSNTLAVANKIIHTKSSKFKIKTYKKLVSFYKEMNLYDSVVNVYDEISTEYLNNNDTINSIKNKNKEAYNYSIIGKQKKALEILYDNIRFADRIKDSDLLSETYMYLGLSTKQTNNRNAKQFFISSLEYNTDTLSPDYSSCLNEIGNIYLFSGNIKKAVYYLHKALKIRNFTHDENIRFSYRDIANAYAEKGNFYEAILYMHKCIEFETNKGIDRELALSYSALGYYYMKAGKMSNAEKYLNISLEYAKKTNVNPIYNDVYSKLYKLYKKKEDYKNALYYYELSKDYEDRISKDNTIKQIAELEEKYINEKQASKLFLMKKQKEASDAIILRQRIIGGIVILLVILLMFFINSLVKSRKKSKDANEVLKKQNEEIKIQNFKIEEDAKRITIANKRIADKNVYITDNIKYARKIQRAMLPSIKYVNGLIPQNFIIYKPKNIVSGDFYSIKEINGKIIIIVADCTGHGVSGAFMSVLGMSLINDIILKDKITEPADFLNTLRGRVINSLKQKKEYTETTDGMDIAICVFDKKNKQIKYAGAQMSLYIATKNGVKRFKPDIMPVGVGFRDERGFSQQTIDITGIETIYMFSDGYPDQFGGKNGRKFMLGNLINIIDEIHERPMNIQKNFLEASLKQWQGTHKQVDDILFAGFRF